MRRACVSAATTLMAIGAVILLAVTPMTSVAVTLAATALFMGGTGHPLSVPLDTPAYIADYVDNADVRYVAPSGLCVGGEPGCVRVAVYTPEQFKLDTGLRDMTFDQSVAEGQANLDACLRGLPCTITEPPFSTTGAPRVLTDTSYVVFGYSQSATIASNEKADLIAHPVEGMKVAFVLISNPNRPNGGVLERFVGLYIPIIGVSFNGATPTDSPRAAAMATVDVAQQYDPAADFPTNPLNLPADLNVALGFIYLHPETSYFNADSLELQGQYQDTTYYLAPTATLPLLMPVERIPVIGPPIAATLDPPLRVLVETGYDRTINPGQPTPAKLLYFPKPFTTAKNFLVAIPTGWDNGIATITDDPANRPFHTEPQGTYGVGGPPVDTGAIDPYGKPTPYVAPNVAANQQDSTSVGTAVEQQALTPVAGTQHGSTTPKATRPNRPTTRLGLAFEPKRLTTSRPSGERPLRRLLDRLTGKSEVGTPAPSSEDAAA